MITPHLSVRTLATPRSIIGFGFSGVAVFLALRGVNLSQVGASLSQVSLPIALAATASALLATVVSTLRWRVLLSPYRAPLSQLVAVFFVSQMCNAVLPGKLGAPLRAGLTSRVTNCALPFALGSVVIERVLDSALIAALSAALLLLLPVPQAVGVLGRDTALIATAVLLILVLLALLRERLAGPAGWLIHRLGLPTSLDRALDALAVLRRRRTYPPLLLLSLLIWFLGTLTNELTLRAMHLSLPWWTPVVLLVALQLGGKLPSSPGNVGIFHYITVVVLTEVGVESSIALTYAVILHFAVFVVPAVVGAVSLWWLSVSVGVGGRAGIRGLPATEIAPPDGAPDEPR